VKPNPSGQCGPVLHLNDALLPATETFVQHRLRPTGRGSIALGWRRVDDGLELPCPAIVLPNRRSGGDLSRLLRVRARAFEELDLLRAVRRVKPALLHAHFGPVGLRALNVAKLLGLPLVVSFYGFDVGHASRTDTRERYQALFHYACVTAEGPYLVKRMRALGARRTALLPLQLPDWCCAPPLARVPSAGPLRLLQVCRLVPKKGVDLSIRAVAVARARGLPIRLEIIGDGPDRTDLELLRRNLGQEDVVSFAGARPYSELAVAFSRADALLQPSRTTAEGDTEGGHPAVVLEAQSQGLPVIATTHADMPMVVQHGNTGLLASEENPADLANAFETLSDLDRGAMGESARARALRRHGPAKVKRLQESIYRKALTIRSPREPA
jgi:colanic acid/amylovoran biosynthesis glycosyltransferase